MPPVFTSGQIRLHHSATRPLVAQHIRDEFWVIRQSLDIEYAVRFLAIGVFPDLFRLRSDRYVEIAIWIEGHAGGVARQFAKKRCEGEQTVVGEGDEMGSVGQAALST